MYYFTTYFDKNYLSRGLTLYESIKSHVSTFKIFILCLDEFTYDFFKNKKDEYNNVVLITLDEIESHNNQLKECKTNRSKIEFYFTLSPYLPLFVIEKYEVPHICSMDADLLFFSSPEKIFKYLDTYSIIITPHKFTIAIEEVYKFGLYNVSFQVFKNDVDGIGCLKLWEKQCIEWCKDELDEVNDRYADQKYLDKWPELFKDKVKVLDDDVSGLAPWNISSYHISQRNQKFYSNNNEIIFYHFHDFKIIGKNWVANGFKYYQVREQIALNKLYLFYWKKIIKFQKMLSISKDISSRVVFDNKWKSIEKANCLYYILFKRYIVSIIFSDLPDNKKYILKKVNA